MNFILESLARTTFILGCILVVLISLLSLYIVYVRRCYSHLPSPPLKTFFLGHGTLLSDRKTHTMFIEWAREYGSVFHIAILHRIMVIVSSPSLTKQILLDSRYPKDKELYKKSQTVAGIRFLGTGLATNLDYENWKLRRSGINPAFHKSTFGELAGIFNDAVDTLIGELDVHADTGKMVSMLDQMHRTTLDVIGKAAFSEDVLAEDDGYDFVGAVSIALKMMSLNFRNPVFNYLPWNKKTITSAQNQMRYLRRRGRRMIENRIRAIANGDRTPNDILDHIVKNLANHCSYNDMVDEVITMFVAGQETTANLLSFLILELGRHPKILAKLYEEVDSVVGSKRFVSLEDVSKLEYTTATLKEILRLHPPVGGTIREVPADFPTKLDGYEIPAKASISVNVFGLHYLHHKDGFDFKPERFLASAAMDQNLEPVPYSYIPFSLGQRSCIGRNFAYLEAKIIAVKFLQRYTFKLNPEESFEVENAGTFRPADEVKIFLAKR